jgi:hypothetical protein
MKSLPFSREQEKKDYMKSPPFGREQEKKDK